MPIITTPVFQVVVYTVCRCQDHCYIIRRLSPVHCSIRCVLFSFKKCADNYYYHQNYHQYIIQDGRLSPIQCRMYLFLFVYFIYIYIWNYQKHAIGYFTSEISIMTLMSHYYQYIMIFTSNTLYFHDYKLTGLLLHTALKSQKASA